MLNKLTMSNIKRDSNLQYFLLLAILFATQTRFVNSEIRSRQRQLKSNKKYSHIEIIHTTTKN